MKFNRREIILAIASVFSGLNASASLAQTAPPLLGGGSTLVQPAIALEGLFFPPADGSITYVGVGSGAGETAFLTNNPADFGTTESGAVDFANSDAPLTPSQISAYQNSLATTNGPLIQIPYVVTPITVPLVNAPTGTGPTLGSAPTVALNDADLCGIFSGQFTNWNQVTNPDTGSQYPYGQITVVFRSDNSGETDLLTAHLARVCPIPSGTFSTPVTFVETQNFASLFQSLPANFVSATGSGGVAYQLLARRSIGMAAVSYLSPAWTNPFLAPSSASAAADQLAVASLRNATTGMDVLPTFQNAAAAVGTFAAPTGLTAGTPAANPVNWVPNASNPTAGYPISGTSQIIVSQCYANHGDTPSVAVSVVDFLTQHYSSDASIMNGNGFATLPSAFETTLVSDFLTARRGDTLNIGNATVCGAVAGR